MAPNRRKSSRQPQKASALDVLHPVTETPHQAQRRIVRQGAARALKRRETVRVGQAIEHHKAALHDFTAARDRAGARRLSASARVGCAPARAGLAVEQVRFYTAFVISEVDNAAAAMREAFCSPPRGVGRAAYELKLKRSIRFPIAGMLAGL